MSNNIKKHKCFGLLEVLIVAAIFVLFAGALISLLMIGSKNAVINKHRLQAADLGREGIELVTNIRNTAWSQTSSVDWNSMVQPCWGFNSGSSKKLVKGDLCGVGEHWYLDNTGPEDILKDNNITFRRTIDVAEGTLLSSNDDRKITVKVEWQDFSKTHSVTFIKYLTNWKDASGGGGGPGETPPGTFIANEFIENTYNHISYILSADKQISFRFTARDSKRVNSLAFWMKSGWDQSFTYRMGLQKDDAINPGTPDGTFQAYVDFNAGPGGGDSISCGAFLRTFTSSPNYFDLTKGQVYHLVTQYLRTNDSRDDPLRVCDLGSPAAKRWPRDSDNPNLNYRDDNLLTLKREGGIWSSLAGGETPRFILGYSDGTIGGQPYLRGEYGVYGSTNHLGGSQVGEKILVMGSDKIVNTIAFRLKKVGSPTGPLYYQIFDGVTRVADGNFAASQVTTSWSWVRGEISVLTLQADKTYTIRLDSPTNSTNRYIVQTMATVYGSFHSETYNGENSFLIYGDGFTWTDSKNADINFRLEYVP